MMLWNHTSHWSIQLSNRMVGFVCRLRCAHSRTRDRTDTVPTQHRAIQSRQALIRSAAEAFSEKGVPASGMVDISRRARLSKGALYFHFASKEDLTLAVRDEALGAVRDLEHELTRAPHPAAAAVRDFAIGLLGRVDADIVVRAGLQLRPETAPGIAEPDLQQRWYALFLEKARADRADGKPPAGDDPQRSAQLLAAVVVGLLHLGQEDRTWWDKDVVTDIWEQLLPADAGTAADDTCAGPGAENATATGHETVTPAGRTAVAAAEEIAAAGPVPAQAR
ncbi:TetR family transcriptional regulator [Streptomyces sp. NPDC059788]|uniref:TetR family transcriptional regulator n=1 Tax=Streptomyces sp. NPDC059788 TaxID=3346948 RepID=UPI00365C3F6B